VISGGKSKLLLLDRSGSWSCCRGGSSITLCKNPWFFAKSEVSQLRQENRTLKQRLEKKDKHIQEMMYHTEKIAAGLAEQNNRRSNHES
jgi:hypothetical protein